MIKSTGKENHQVNAELEDSIKQHFRGTIVYFLGLLFLLICDALNGCLVAIGTNLVHKNVKLNLSFLKI